MNIIEINVSKQNLTVRAPCELVAGTVGLYGVKVTYDEEWDATPQRLILFDGCKEIKLEDTGEVIAIPWECIEKPCYLRFGLLGLDGNGETRITTYSDSDNNLEVLPKDWKGGEETDEPPAPTPTIYEQLKKDIEGKASKSGYAPDKYIGTDKDGNLVERDIEVSQEDIEKSVNDYLKEHPIEVEDEIFVAEYGVTTYAEVLEAYNLGKEIKANAKVSITGFTDNHLFCLTQFSQSNTTSYFVFGAIVYGQNTTLTLDKANGWKTDRYTTPTKTSQLENDSFYSKEQINEMISTIPKFNIEVVETLPTENISETTVYLLKSGEEENNLYTEYIYKNGVWEKLGTQTLDLSGYAEKDYVDNMFKDYVTDIAELVGGGA